MNVQGSRGLFPEAYVEREKVSVFSCLPAELCGGYDDLVSNGSQSFTRRTTELVSMFAQLCQLLKPAMRICDTEFIYGGISCSVLLWSYDFPYTTISLKNKQP